MPTMEEHYSLKDEVTALTNQSNQLRKQVQTSDERIADLKETIEKKEEDLRQKLSEMTEIKAKNHDLE